MIDKVNVEVKVRKQKDKFVIYIDSREYRETLIIRNYESWELKCKKKKLDGLV